jgi:hypothetical protein
MLSWSLISAKRLQGVYFYINYIVYGFGAAAILHTAIGDPSRAALLEKFEKQIRVLKKMKSLSPSQETIRAASSS